MTDVGDCGAGLTGGAFREFKDEVVNDKSK